MYLEKKYLLLNLDTDDLAEQMIKEEDYKHTSTSDEKHINNLLKEHGLSISSLEGSYATIHNVDNKLYIRFDINTKIYSPTLLEYIEKPLFIKFATSFNIPKKVRILNASTQVGGYIDTNYGIKFKIALTKEKANAIYETKTPKKNKKEYRKQADIYIRRKLRYSLNDDSYNADIDSFLIMMKDFYIEGLGQTKYHESIKGTFSVVYTKDKAFHLAKHQKEYYGITEINNVFFIYKVVDKDVYIIGDVKNISNAQEAILRYKAMFS
jgi:hypothetical protein